MGTILFRASCALFLILAASHALAQSSVGGRPAGQVGTASNSAESVASTIGALAGEVRALAADLAALVQELKALQANKPQAPGKDATEEEKRPISGR